MPALLRVVSFVAFAALLVFVAIELVTQHGHSSLIIALIVVVAFALPAIALSLALIRARAALDEFTRAATHLASGRTTLDLDESSERQSPGLSKALAQIATELARRERTYEEHQQAMHEILTGIGEGVLAIDLDRRVRVANRRVSELFQLESDVVGREYIDVIRNAQLVRAFDSAVRGTGSVARATLPVRGELRHIEMRVAPLRRGDLAAVALFIDVTEIEKLQAVRREFMADFHHEVRTPLAAIRLAVESLDNPATPVAQAEHLRRILTRQVARLQRLVDEVGQLNEIESGELVLHREPTDLKALAGDVVDDLSDVAARAGVTLSVQGDDISADVDALKIGQVISNLVENAIRHSGTKDVKVEVAARADGACVAVIDHGRGIPPEEQEKIFHRFYRVDKSRSNASEGTGLGLAIAKHLMRRHGGSVRVVSEAGSGARFELHFPR